MPTRPTRLHVCARPHDPHEPLPTRLKIVIPLAATVLFTVSAWRHRAQHSTAFDLGFYDQILYLLSRGEAPVSSFLGFHFLGDHVARAAGMLVWLGSWNRTVRQLSRPATWEAPQEAVAGEGAHLLYEMGHGPFPRGQTMLSF